MKNIFKYIVPCMAVAFALTSCNSTMDDKASIDAQYEKATTATVALTSAAAEDFQNIAATGAVTNESEVIEVGFQLCASADFASGVKSVACKEVAASFSATIAGLKEQSTYYVRAYAFTKTAGMIVTEGKSVTTPKAPIFPLDGVYTATEYEMNMDDGSWNANKPFEITFEFDKEDPTIVYITNIWGGAMTVKGQYDEAKGIITVPNDQVVFTYEGYGDFTIHGVNDEFTGYTSSVKFQFTALGGKMASGYIAIQNGGEDYSYVYYTMEHK